MADDYALTLRQAFADDTMYREQITLTQRRFWRKIAARAKLTKGTANLGVVVEADIGKNTSHTGGGIDARGAEKACLFRA